MLKTLLKKDIAAFLSFFLMGKDGKRRSVGVSIAFALLMVYGFGAMCVMFWEMSKQLCPALIATGNHWVFFAIMGVMAKRNMATLAFYRRTTCCCLCPFLRGRCY